MPSAAELVPILGAELVTTLLAVLGIAVLVSEKSERTGAVWAALTFWLLTQSVLAAAGVWTGSPGGAS